MTHITKNQEAVIVRLFASGTSVAELCVSWQVPITRIEAIIRKAMQQQGEAFKP